MCDFDPRIGTTSHIAILVQFQLLTTRPVRWVVLKSHPKQCNVLVKQAFCFSPTRPRPTTICMKQLYTGPSLLKSLFSLWLLTIYILCRTELVFTTRVQYDVVCMFMGDNATHHLSVKYSLCLCICSRGLPRKRWGCWRWLPTRGGAMEPRTSWCRSALDALPVRH